ncbi:MAG: hypothetical protein CMI54_06165, partial [Parcubacteria group bacterium]|nr:hypothetical protein [Parcubacteria group bacterium]
IMNKDKCTCDSCKCNKHTRELKQIKVEQPIMFDLPSHWHHRDMCIDPLVQRVVDNILERSKEGMKTYGVSMEDNDTKTLEEWITDAQEEMMDGVIYLEKIKAKISDVKKLID